MMVKLFFIVVFLLLTFSDGKPVKGKTTKASGKAGHKAHPKAPGVKSNVDALKFLDKFGYNSCTGHGSGKTAKGEPLCQSNYQTMIEHFQTIYHLPVTGKLDKKTLDYMNKPRCSLGDYPLAYSAFRPWPNTTLKWRLTNEIPSFGRDKTRLHLKEAFSDWARYAPLKFREAEDDEKAEFTVSFEQGNHTDGYPFDGAGGTLAHAFFPTDGKLHFDATEDWTDTYDGKGFNLRLVASHELGHALGLAHSTDPKSLMFPFYQLMQPKDLLPTDDQDGIRALYGASATNKPTTFQSTTIKTTTAKYGKPTKKPHTTRKQILSNNRCALYLDVVFGGGPDKWLYTLDYDHVWRYHPDFDQWDTQPLPITDVFPGAESHMMAGILSPVTKKTYLFKGYRVWRFTQNSLDAGFPKRLHGTGTPYNPIAALYDDDSIWLLKGDLLYKLDEKKMKYEFNTLPKRVYEQFPGVPKHVRSAFTHDEKHYFFTEPDQKVYIFDTTTRRLEPGYPKPMTTGWFACKGNN